MKRRNGLGMVEMAFSALIIAVSVIAVAISLMVQAKAMPNQARCLTSRTVAANTTTDTTAAGAVDGPVGVTVAPVAVGSATTTLTAQSDGAGVTLRDSKCLDSVNGIYVPLGIPSPLPT